MSVGLDARLTNALEQGRCDVAAAIADTLIGGLRARHAPRSLALAAGIDSLALRLASSDGIDCYRHALDLLGEVLSIRERARKPDALEIAGTMTNMAVLAGALGQLADARDLQRRAIERSAGLLAEDSPERVRGALNLGQLDYYIGAYAEAESVLARLDGVLAASASADTSRRIQTLAALAETRRAHGRYAEALAPFRAALELARADPVAHREQLVSALNNLGGLYKDLEWFDQAEPLLDESLRLRLADSTATPRQLAVGFLNRAEVLRLQGDNDDALPLYVRALERARAGLSRDDPTLATFMNQLAASLEDDGRAAEAESLYREASDQLARTAPPTFPPRAQTLHDLGRLLRIEGRRSEAEASLNEALELRKSILGESSFETAESRLELGLALADGDSTDQSRALELAQQARASLAGRTVAPVTHIRSLALAARLLRARGRGVEAGVPLEQAIALVDSTRAHRGGGEEKREAFIAGVQDLYEQQFDARLAAGDLAGALDSHDRGRARVLLEALTARALRNAEDPRRMAAPTDSAEVNLRGEMANLRSEMDRAPADAGVLAPKRRGALETRLDSLTRELRVLRDRNRRRDPAWQSAIETLHALPPFEALRDSLAPRDGALLVYHVGRERSGVFLISRSRPLRWVPLSLDTAAANALRESAGSLTRDTLDRIVFGARIPSLRHPGILPRMSKRPVSAPPAADDWIAADLERRSHALWRVLVPPNVWRELRRLVRVTIVPDAALQGLPFEALPTRSGEKGPRARFWLDDGPAIRYAGSLRTMLVAARQTNAVSGARALTICNPRPAPPESAGSTLMAGLAHDAWDDLGPLPGTEIESQRLVDAFPPGVVVRLRGSAATERAVRAAMTDASIVHFGTHGFVVGSRDNLLAGLVLAKSGSDDLADDGVLQLFEILDLTLRSPVVVLSACETHRGPEVAGEGVAALSRAFIVAGAAEVIGSLWSVDDASTAKLMGAFFDSMGRQARRSRPLDIDVALRNAKRVVRADPRSQAPFFWSAFLMVGAR